DTTPQRAKSRSTYAWRRSDRYSPHAGQPSYNRRVRSGRSAVALVATAIGLVLILGAERAPGRSIRSGRTLTVASSLKDLSLDPALSVSYANLVLFYATCSTLMAFRDAPAPAGYTVRPEAAAARPKISRDGRTYVFTVRKGLRFSDRSPVTAANFARA